MSYEIKLNETLGSKGAITTFVELQLEEISKREGITYNMLLAEIALDLNERVFYKEVVNNAKDGFAIFDHLSFSEVVKMHGSI